MTDGPVTPPPPPPPMRDWDEPPPPPFDPAATSKLQPVGIALVAYNALSVMTGLSTLLFLPTVREVMQDEAKRNPELARAAEIYQSSWFAGSLVFGALLAIFALTGSIFLLRGRVYGLAMAGAIVTMLNPGGCCCLIGMGLGIWALAIMVKPEVHAAFNRP